MRISRLIQAIDAHACGEPGRVIVGGVMDVPGETMFDKMTHFLTRADGLRKLMLREPRGYPAANCNLILPPTCPEADAGFIIMEQTEYPGMSGTNTICVATVLLEAGIVPMLEPVTELTLEAPAGLVRVRAECRNGKVQKVTFRNVPAFAVYLDTPVEVPHPRRAPARGRDAVRKRRAGARRRDGPHARRINPGGDDRKPCPRSGAKSQSR